MTITGETKFFLGIITVTIAILIGALLFFSKPSKIFLRSEMIPQGANTKANTDAKTYLVEFSDFQCPACKSYSAVVNEIVGKNSDKLVFSYRHFPLDQHQFAMKAALAAEAAAVQGKFWEMHDLLFENQEKLSETIFAELAAKLNLDMAKFDMSFNDPKIREKVAADKAYGESIGIDSTPTFFLNGRKINPSSFAEFSGLIDKSISSN